MESPYSQCATEYATHAPEQSQSQSSLPLTSPHHGYIHPISQNLMFTAPPGSRFVLAPNASLSITIYHARNLDYEGAKCNPFVRAVQGDYKYMTTTTHSENPVWNETFKFLILNPIKELLIIEVWDDKSIGKSLIGYFPVDLSLLPRGVEVDTWEKLSHSSNGELSIGFTACGFGLECLPGDYDRLYEDWRPTIPAVSKNSPVSTTKKNNNNNNSSSSSVVLEVPGPYAGKNVPHGYIVDNGHVKRVPSVMTKAIGRAKGFLGMAAR